MSGSKSNGGQTPDGKAAWLVAVFIFFLATMPAAAQNESNTVAVTIILGEGRWSLGVGIDGAATLTHDTVPWSAIRVASGTFPFREVVEDVARAMSMAPQPPDPKRDHATLGVPPRRRAD